MAANRDVQTLFLLLPRGADLDQLFTGDPPLPTASRAQVRLRCYPPANDARHLSGLVRAGRDPAATRSRRGLLLAIGGGALLGTVTNGILAGAFGMFGGLFGIALPLGFVLGAFLGGFTAAMTGTEVARREVLDLALSLRAGDRLVQCGIADVPTARELQARCELLGWRSSLATAN